MHRVSCCSCVCVCVCVCVWAAEGGFLEVVSWGNVADRGCGWLLNHEADSFNVTPNNIKTFS